MTKKTKTSLYKDLVNSMINKKKIIGSEQQVFQNFFDKLEEEMYLIDYYDPELMEHQILLHLQNNDPNMIKSNIDNDLISLEEEIREIFLINKDIHFLICPLQNSVLLEDVTFSNLIFLKKRETEDEFIKVISVRTKLTEEKVKGLLTHTRKSRSKDFLKDNILIIKIEDQTSLIKRTAYSIVEDVFNYLRVVYYAVEATTSYFDQRKVRFNQENKHVAILSKDDWRNGHGSNLHSNLQINLDLDFIKDEGNQLLIDQMIKKLTFNRQRDTFYCLFYNAIILFNRALVYEVSDVDVSNLLLLSAGESLLTKNQNEKRLRLSVILPRLVHLSKMNTVQIAKLVNKHYHNRNDFVHGGVPARKSKIDIELKQCLAKLIVFNLNFTSLAMSEGKKVRENKWFDYVNSVFDNAVFGQEENESVDLTD